MTVQAKGKTLLAPGPDGVETHALGSTAEAKARAAFINEGLSWIGTPFRDCAGIKGRNGAVDCAMLLVRSAVDTGRFEPFDPRKPEFGGPYSPRWHLHRSEELFVNWISGRLNAKEVDKPRVGDVVLWRFGRTFSHGAILINSQEVVHAYYADGCCLVTRLDNPLLTHVSAAGQNFPRAVRYFDLWSSAK